LTFDGLKYEIKGILHYTVQMFWVDKIFKCLKNLLFIVERNVFKCNLFIPVMSKLNFQHHHSSLQNYMIL